jgi:hypothetical protein
VRAFQPQNPRSINANATLDKNAKRPSTALVDTEGLLGLDGTMGAGLAVTRVFSCLNFSRVVLDFLFCCHNLEMNFVLGGAPRSFNGQVWPLFSFPHSQKKTAIIRAPKRGGGVPF